MINFIMNVFAIYAATFLVAKSHIFAPVRELFRELIDGLTNPKSKIRFLFVMVNPITNQVMQIDPEASEPIIEIVDEEERELAPQGYDFISCRMCIGVWITLLTCAWRLPVIDSAAIYGASYWLATQER